MAEQMPIKCGSLNGAFKPICLGTRMQLRLAVFQAVLGKHHSGWTSDRLQSQHPRWVRVVMRTAHPCWVCLVMGTAQWKHLCADLSFSYMLLVRSRRLKHTSKSRDTWHSLAAVQGLGWRFRVAGFPIQTCNF